MLQYKKIYKQCLNSYNQLRKYISKQHNNVNYNISHKNNLTQFNNYNKIKQLNLSSTKSPVPLGAKI